MTTRLSLPKLPRPSTWNSIYVGKGKSPYVHSRPCKGRLCYVNYPQVRQNILDLSLQEQKGTIIELFPGPGLHTRALLNETSARIISIEPCPEYEEDLEALSAASNGRHLFSNLDGIQWTTYGKFSAPGGYLETVPKKPWNEVQHDLSVYGHIPASNIAEQFFVQLITCLLHRTWLYSYGRIRMGLWVDPRIGQRVIALPGDKARSMLSVKCETTADVRVVSEPPEDQFWSNKTRGPKGRHHTDRLSLIEIIPKENYGAIAPIEVFEYVLRRLFIRRKHSLRKAITELGFDAETLLDHLDSSIIPSSGIEIASMTASQFWEVSRAFDQWDLKPKQLVDHDPSAIRDNRM